MISWPRLFIAERYTEKLKSLDTLYNTDMSRIKGYEIIFKHQDTT